jgi:hypothetical protein
VVTGAEGVWGPLAYCFNLPSCRPAGRNRARLGGRATRRALLPLPPRSAA